MTVRELVHHGRQLHVNAFVDEFRRAPVEVLGGFVSPDGKAYGRPVGVAIDGKGALIVADDVGNTIWRLAR